MEPLTKTQIDIIKHWLHTWNLAIINSKKQRLGNLYDKLSISLKRGKT